MKKTMLLISVAFMASSLLGANDRYLDQMKATIDQFNTSGTIDDLQSVANKFGVIGNVETKEWLPLYYQAHCYILMSFMDETGPEIKDRYLDQAESVIGKMLVLAPGESEVYAIQALYYTGRLVVNPPERSQTTAPLIGQSIGRSLGLDPQNPRARYIKLTNEIGTARFFGSDTSPFCETARELLESWDVYPVKSEIHPAWGKNQVEGIIQSCGE